MGVKSTHDIERALAIKIIQERVDTCTNAQIANMLEEFDESEYRNYIVWNELPSERDSGQFIDTMEDFDMI